MGPWPAHSDDDLDIVSDRFLRNIQPVLNRRPLTPEEQSFVILAILRIVPYSPSRDKMWEIVQEAFKGTPTGSEILRHLEAYREAAWHVVPDLMDTLLPPR